VRCCESDADPLVDPGADLILSGAMCRLSSPAFSSSQLPDRIGIAPLHRLSEALIADAVAQPPGVLPPPEPDPNFRKFVAASSMEGKG
jgi:hypothetical protein